MNFTRFFFIRLRLFLAIVLSIILIVVDCKIGLFTRIRSYVDTSIGTLYSFIKKPSQFLNNTLRNFSLNNQIQSENKKLKHEIHLKNIEVILLNQYKKENEHLRKLLDANLHQDERIMLGRVMFSSSIPYANQVIIDKGKIDGVYKNQSVISDRGIVGQIISVNRNTSRVLLSCCSLNGIAVKAIRNNVHAIVLGKGCNKDFQLKYLTSNDMQRSKDLHLGDIIVTSNLDNNFPEGYPVGIVSSIKIYNKAPYVYIQIHPMTNFKNLDYLLLLWKKDNANNHNIKLDSSDNTSDSSDNTSDSSDNTS
ncbi:MAG: rod shape-determining protein MreC, partial [Pantoea sp. Edef]|nr:rod shape-determining protein MreC [Pantoea sp. Edef]